MLVAGVKAASYGEASSAEAEALVVLTGSESPPPCISEIRKNNKIKIFTIEIEELPDNVDLLDRHRIIVISLTAPTTDQTTYIHKLLQEIHDRKLLSLILTYDPPQTYKLFQDPGDPLPRIHCCRADISGQEFYGRLCSLAHYAVAFDRLDQYLDQLEDWALAMNNRFEELHNELRLAWRVQQDFLPKRLPHADRVRFAALYRPANWVSGDIYDIVRLDERHVGFCVADVVGHGVAAGLMTLFVKRALVTRETYTSSYRLVPPREALARLNNDLCHLELPEQQFVTACYGLLNVETLDLAVARGGHPLPILIDPSGRVTRLEVSGPLLGVFARDQFTEARVKLTPGSKVILITDGVEQAFGDDSESEQTVADHLAGLSSFGAEELIEAFQAILDCQEKSLHPRDDITMVVAEVLDNGRGG